ncbi:MAG TPA: BON domain-containing protein [Burkholderiales bacterium]|nr:BON domain-containing protein [Burkholderiales bacterium]
MKKIHLLLAVVLSVSAALLQGCFPVFVGAGAGAALSAADRRTTGAQVEDEGIELKISGHISERYGDKVHIDVTSFNRAVLLTGEVADEKTRADIEKIALGMPNVRGVTNEIEIAGLPSGPAHANDAYLSAKVKGRFLEADKFNPIHVKVVTEAGVVYLMGIVTEQEAADAVEIARTTGGVRKVVKIFEYCKPTDPNCRPHEKAAAEPKK